MGAFELGMGRGLASMDVIPAVDLKGRKCVRLYQGDYRRETVFSEDPAAMAARWEKQGAARLHLVDLDGAASGQVCHWDIIRDVARRVRIPLQVGGGVRNLETIDKLLAEGAQRVILGTVAVEDPSLVKEACARYGERIIISVDARDGYVSTRGWKTSTRMKAVELAERMVGAGALRLIYTDIASDGTLEEPNFAGIAEMVSKVAVPLLAAGGVSDIGHIRRLKEIGVEGAIVGKALYAGDFDLKKALEVSRGK